MVPLEIRHHHLAGDSSSDAGARGTNVRGMELGSHKRAALPRGRAHRPGSAGAGFGATHAGTVISDDHLFHAGVRGVQSVHARVLGLAEPLSG